MEAAADIPAELSSVQLLFIMSLQGKRSPNNLIFHVESLDVAKNPKLCILNQAAGLQLTSGCGGNLEKGHR